MDRQDAKGIVEQRIHDHYRGWEDVVTDADNWPAVNEWLMRPDEPCEHDWELRRFQQIDGRWRVSLQCKKCLANNSAVKNPPNIDELPVRIEIDWNSAYALRQEYRDKAYQLFQEIQQQARSVEWDIERQRYEEYLKSPEWKVKAAKVRVRCGNVCEGCRERKVDDIHHLSYAHKYDEFLFELVGLCRQCHERWHQIKAVSQS